MHPEVTLLARYGFIRRDGRTTFDELVSGAVNFWNMGYGPFCRPQLRSHLIDRCDPFADQAVFLVAADFSRNGDLQTQRM